MLQTLVNKIQYAPNGVTTVFAFPYYFLDNAHIVVTITDALGDDTLQVITTDYTLAGAGDQAGGAVTMIVAPESGTTLTIARIVPLTQLVDYVANDNFPEETHERALDKLTMICQQLDDALSRSLHFPDTEALTSNSEIDDIIDRQNTVIYFDENGDLAFLDYDTFIAAITPASGSLTIGAPTGNATTKSVSIQFSNGGYWKSHIWLIDGTNNTPTLAESIVLPEGIDESNWDEMTDANGELTVSLTNTGAESSWRVCTEAFGQIVMSNEITIGV